MVTLVVADQSNERHLARTVLAKCTFLIFITIWNRRTDKLPLDADEVRVTLKKFKDSNRNALTAYNKLYTAAVNVCRPPCYPL